MDRKPVDFGREKEVFPLLLIQKEREWKMYGFGPEKQVRKGPFYRTQTAPLSQIIAAYSISTSNHNPEIVRETLKVVVAHSISTSNHNHGCATPDGQFVVAHSISTSNHNSKVVSNSRKKL